MNTLRQWQQRPAFADRHEAGVLLAAQLRQFAGRSDVVVLALPRGGVPVGSEVARALGAPSVRSWCGNQESRLFELVRTNASCVRPGFGGHRFRTDTTTQVFRVQSEEEPWQR